MKSFGNLRGVYGPVRTQSAFPVRPCLILTSRLAIVGLQGMFSLKGTAAVGVGALEYPVAERKRLAAAYVSIHAPRSRPLTNLTVSSRDWVCPKCNCPNLELLPDPSSGGGSSDESSTAEETSAASSTVPSIPATPAVIADVKQKGPADTLPPRTDASAPQIPILSPRPQRPSPPPAILINPLSIPQTPQTVSPRPAAEAVQQINVPKAPAAPSSSRLRPPVILDTVICVLLVLLFALIAKRVF